MTFTYTLEARIRFKAITNLKNNVHNRSSGFPTAELHGFSLDAPVVWFRTLPPNFAYIYIYMQHIYVSTYISGVNEELVFVPNWGNDLPLKCTAISSTQFRTNSSSFPVWISRKTPKILIMRHPLGVISGEGDTIPTPRHLMTSTTPHISYPEYPRTTNTQVQRSTYSVPDCINSRNFCIALQTLIKLLLVSPLHWDHFNLASYWPVHLPHT